MLNEHYEFDHKNKSFLCNCVANWYNDQSPWALSLCRRFVWGMRSKLSKQKLMQLIWCCKQTSGEISLNMVANL